MNPHDKTERSQTERISFELELFHPPEKVWRALTDPQLLSEWLLPIAALDLQPGAEFRFTAPPQPEWDGIVNGRILEADAPRKLSYSWVVGDLDTIVTFTLKPTESGTWLSLLHSGFQESQKRNFGGARYGWGLMSDRLVELLSRTS